MPPSDKLKDNQIFPAAMRESVLIVTPQGDAAGYGSNDFYRELNNLLALIEQSEETPHVLVDLSMSNYFGSNVIGAIASLGMAAKNRGGRFLICGASEDMTGILQVMKIDSLYTSYPTRKEALDEIAPMSLKDWWQLSKKPLLITLGVLLLATGVVLLMQLQKGRVEQQYYDTVVRIWEEVKLNRTEGLSPKAWVMFKNRSLDELEPMRKKLEKAGVREPIKQQLLFAVRDELIPIMERPGAESPDKEISLERRLERIKAMLEAKQNGATPDELHQVRDTIEVE